MMDSDAKKKKTRMEKRLSPTSIRDNIVKSLNARAKQQEVVNHDQ